MREVRSSELSAVSIFQGAIFALIVLSFLINVLALSGSFYMLQVYDRVLPSHSVPTLVALSLLAAGLMTFHVVLEALRSKLTRRVAHRVDAKLMPLAHEASMHAQIGGVRRAEAMQPVRDVDAIRGYLSGQGPNAILDLPWMPIYILFAVLLHPILGLMVVGGIFFLIATTLFSEWRMRNHQARLLEYSVQRQALLDETTRNAEVAYAMGFDGRLNERFLQLGDKLLAESARGSDSSASIMGMSRLFRMLLQSAILGMGAYLVIGGQVSAGAIIAASIVSARALAPIELAITNWQGLVQMRQARQRLHKLLLGRSSRPERIELPAPRDSLRVEGLSAAVPGSKRLVLDTVNFELKAGQVLGVIGPSAAGKSSLARSLVGVWPATSGAVRLDGARLDQWSPGARGRHIGYVPQDVQLFDGTITENISRFDAKPDNDAVIKAAVAANVHQLILKFPQGYETRVGSDGSHLSAGQRQRIALARALYRDPFFVVLDEPNSNLDMEGEAALIDAVRAIRARGGIVVMIAHRSNALAAVDQLMLLAGGRVTAFGPRDDVLRQVMRQSPPPAGAAARAQMMAGSPVAARSGPDIGPEVIQLKPSEPQQS